MNSPFSVSQQQACYWAQMPPWPSINLPSKAGSRLRPASLAVEPLLRPRRLPACCRAPQGRTNPRARHRRP